MLQFDIAIIGGGITGLWLSAVLKAGGYNVVLFEKDALGSGQTLASQGIVHGGTKYALTGKLTGSSEAVRAMPERWKTHLAGKASPDLGLTGKNTDHQWMWAAGGLSSSIANFFASKVMRSRVIRVAPENLPDMLKSRAVYQLDEPVLDVKSLLKQLKDIAGDAAYRARVSSISDDNGRCQLMLQTDNDNEAFQITTSAVVFTAGEGNEDLQHAPMQRRPLHMVMVKGSLPKIWAHIIEADANPRITITSHKTMDNDTVWYMGGQLAEDGVTRDEKEQIRYAIRELASLLPDIDWSSMQWSTLKVNRAEGLQPNGKRPDNPVIIKDGNKFTIWPTKLVFAPLVADTVLEYLIELGIKPGEDSDRLPLPDVEVGDYPWDTAIWLTEDLIS